MAIKSLPPLTCTSPNKTMTEIKLVSLKDSSFDMKCFLLRRKILNLEQIIGLYIK